MKALIIIIILLFFTESHKQHRPNVVQFNITKLLNARPVTTLNNNHLTTWTKGIDGNGTGDGYLTQSAALFTGDKDPRALPDRPLIPANGKHPDIQLHYANTNSVHNQTCNLSGESEISFTVTKAKYTDIYLALTSSEGSSALKVTLSYIEGDEVKNFTLPDYYLDIPATDTTFCYLVHDLAKWGPKNNMTEKDHHNIDLMNIHPNPDKVLKSIRVSKTKPGYLVFWAAAGVKR